MFAFMMSSLLYLGVLVVAIRKKLTRERKYLYVSLLLTLAFVWSGVLPRTYSDVLLVILVFSLYLDDN